MLLSSAEVELFYATFMPLLDWVNERKQVVPDLTLTAPQGLDPTLVAAVRDALWADPSLLATFVADNPRRLSSESLALAASWKHHRAGTFTVYRQLTKHAVVLGEESPATVYAVLGLNTPPGEMVPWLPAMVKGVLMPFGDRVVFDGLLLAYSVRFGPGIRRSLADQYRAASKQIVTSLLPATSKPAAVTKAPGPKKLAAPLTKKPAVPEKPIKDAGRCEGCGELFSKRAIGRHLDHCAALSAPPKGKKLAQALRLVVESPGLSQYWLHIDAPLSLTLGHVDALLRSVWLECCDHLSGFDIGGVHYASNSDSDSDGWSYRPERAMTRTRIAEVAAASAWKYDYDYGSTTRLRIRPVGLRTAPAGSVRLVARNVAPTWPCIDCGAPATKICLDCQGESGGEVCQKCAKKHERHGDGLALLVNSPRAGVCGYNG